MSVFLFVVISTIIYYSYQVLSELGIWKSLFIILAFFALWAALPFFFRSVNTIIREARYRWYKSKYSKQNTDGDTETESR